MADIRPGRHVSSGLRPQERSSRIALVTGDILIDPLHDLRDVLRRIVPRVSGTTLHELAGVHQHIGLPGPQRQRRTDPVQDAEQRRFGCLHFPIEPRRSHCDLKRHWSQPLEFDVSQRGDTAGWSVVPRAGDVEPGSIGKNRPRAIRSPMPNGGIWRKVVLWEHAQRKDVSAVKG